MNLPRWLSRSFYSKTDKGYFDPFLPITKLKTIEHDFEEQLYFASDETIARESNIFSILLRVVIVAVFVTFFTRLVFLQITQAQENLLLAEGNRLKAYQLLAPRGLIFDRNGIALVKNVPTFALGIRSSDVPKKTAELAEFISRIAQGAQKTEEEISTVIKRDQGLDFVTIIDNISREEAIRYEVRLNGVNGLEVLTNPTREYVNVPGLSHIIGYISKANAKDIEQRPNLRSNTQVGRAGVERVYDEFLQGTPGIETVEVDSKGNFLRSIGTQPSQVGRSLLLTIDSNLQTTAANSLQAAIEKSQAKSGSLVVMDVRTGEVLAMVSYPYYDNNVFVKSELSDQRQAILDNPLSPLLNRAISGQFPSGSTIKPLVATAALEEGIVNESTRIDTSAGKIEVGASTFVDWKVHGVTDVKQAIAESNNIFFYTVGGGHDKIKGLGADKLAKWYSRFGLGEISGIDLLGEQEGNVPTPAWKKQVKNEAWYLGDTYNMSIGQGDLLLTPLQLTRAISSIANGGRLLVPRIVKSILSDGSNEQADRLTETANSSVAASGNLEVVRKGMRQTVISGSARSFNNLPVEVAAKTGTAQFDVGKEKTHSWFTSFAPYQNPELAISVIVEGGGEGYVVAAPVARNIIEAYFHLPLTPIVEIPKE